MSEIDAVVVRADISAQHHVLNDAYYQSGRLSNGIYLSVKLKNPKSLEKTKQKIHLKGYFRPIYTVRIQTVNILPALDSF